MNRANLKRFWTEGPEWRRAVLVLLLFAGIFIVLAVVRFGQKSATWDEPIHLAAGYAALSESDYRIEPTHPPFLRMWAALPLLALEGVGEAVAQIDETPPAEWLPAGYAFAHRFLYREHDADRLLYAARFMSVFWGVVLGVLVFCWAREWLGFKPAVMALAFYTIEPNISAHSSLVTTDFGVTCFIFGAIYCLWRTSRRPSVLNIGGAALFTALAVISKFSGVLIGPMALALIAIAWPSRSRIKATTAAAVIALMILGSVAAIWAVYGFRYAPSTTGGWSLQQRDFPVIRERLPVLAAAADWVDGRRLLPNAFTQGFLLSHATSRLSSYLAGEISNEGWWYYFPLAFLLKTPAVLIALFIAGMVLLVWKRRRHGAVNGAFVVIPIVIYLGFAVASGINIGLRHILPIYPFVLLIAAAAAGELAGWRRPIGRYTLAVLTALWVIGFASVYPHTLTFFNVFAGGPHNGLAYLSDSNLDWGQDLKLLKAWTDRNHVAHLNLAYFGTADPDYYKIAATPLPGAPFFASQAIARPVLPGYVAVSATVLSGVYLPPVWRLFYSGFANQQPVARIGNSIGVYWLDQWPETDYPRGVALEKLAEAQLHRDLGDALFFELGWPELAVRQYEKSLTGQSADSTALGRIGMIRLAAGDLAGAIHVLSRAVDARPDDAEVRSRLASALLQNRQLVEAAEHAMTAVTLNPDDPMAHDVLGVALAVAGRSEDAIAAFKHALKLAPDFEDAQFHLERLEEYLRLGS